MQKFRRLFYSFTFMILTGLAISIPHKDYLKAQEESYKKYDAEMTEKLINHYYEYIAFNPPLPPPPKPVTSNK